jgi:hypothetical protein
MQHLIKIYGIFNVSLEIVFWLKEDDTVYKIHG